MDSETEPPSSSLSLVLKEYTTPPTLHLESRPLPGEAVPGQATVKILVHSLLSYSSALLSGILKYPLNLPLVPGGGAVMRLASPVPPDATSLIEGDLCLFTPIVRGRDDGDYAILIGIHGGATPGATTLIEGFWRDGVMAEYANVPLENLYRLDENKLCGDMRYSFADLAYMQRLMVPMGGLCSLDVKAGERVVIAPASGSFGGAAVQVARALGADVVMVGRKRESLEKIKGVLLEKSSSVGKIDVVALT
jgi:NADPH:quinone reductase-like Zn-dependent oxidoreductase